MPSAEDIYLSVLENNVSNIMTGQGEFYTGDFEKIPEVLQKDVEDRVSQVLQSLEKDLAGWAQAYQAIGGKGELTAEDRASLATSLSVSESNDISVKASKVKGIDSRRLMRAYEYGTSESREHYTLRRLGIGLS